MKLPEPARDRPASRLQDYFRDLYLRTDWERVIVLTVIGLCAIGLFFVLEAYREWRMNR